MVRPAPGIEKKETASETDLSGAGPDRQPVINLRAQLHPCIFPLVATGKGLEQRLQPPGRQTTNRTRDEILAQKADAPVDAFRMPSVDASFAARHIAAMCCEYTRCARLYIAWVKKHRPR